jgi:hypothetical protein
MRTLDSVLKALIGVRARKDSTAPLALPRYARAVALRATRPLRGLRALRVERGLVFPNDGASNSDLRSDSMLRAHLGAFRNAIIDDAVSLKTTCSQNRA